MAGKQHRRTGTAASRSFRGRRESLRWPPDGVDFLAAGDVGRLTGNVARVGGVDLARRIVTHLKHNPRFQTVAGVFITGLRANRPRRQSRNAQCRLCDVVQQGLSCAHVDILESTYNEPQLFARVASQLCLDSSLALVMGDTDTIRVERL